MVLKIVFIFFLFLALATQVALAYAVKARTDEKTAKNVSLMACASRIEEYVPKRYNMALNESWHGSSRRRSPVTKVTLSAWSRLKSGGSVRRKEFYRLDYGLMRLWVAAGGEFAVILGY
jgi:hypothetical protein